MRRAIRRPPTALVTRLSGIEAGFREHICMDCAMEGSLVRQGRQMSQLRRDHRLSEVTCIERSRNHRQARHLRCEIYRAAEDLAEYEIEFVNRPRRESIGRHLKQTYRSDARTLLVATDPIPITRRREFLPTRFPKRARDHPPTFVLFMF
ncbi:MAG TPA: hypothetical protein VKZ79_03635 [Alphaproteobacteria bacterium]|nr:hypothetical protein [Alphaproteobacteria bacterium]